MKLKNIIRSYFLKESKKEYKHISDLEKQILMRVREEKELEVELDKNFTPAPRPFWTFRLPLAFATIVLLVFFVGVLSNNSPAFAKGSIIDALIGLKNQLQQELTQLLSNDPSYRDKDTQKYKQTQQEWCSVSARSPEEQEKAVAAIRDFMDRPDANVEYECVVRNPNKPDEEPLIETYTLDFDRFIIDIKTNQVIEMAAIEGTWGENKDGSRWSSPEKEYDYTPRYTQLEAERQAREFITDHQIALGEIDLEKLTLTREANKDELGNLNYFFIWRGDPREENGEIFTPQLTLTMTQGGQIVHFSNHLKR
jgi:hypothetical protein